MKINVFFTGMVVTSILFAFVTYAINQSYIVAAIGWLCYLLVVQIGYFIYIALLSLYESKKNETKISVFGKNTDRKAPGEHVDLN